MHQFIAGVHRHVGHRTRRPVVPIVTQLIPEVPPGDRGAIGIPVTLQFGNRFGRILRPMWRRHARVSGESPRVAIKAVNRQMPYAPCNGRYRRGVGISLACTIGGCLSVVSQAHRPRPKRGFPQVLLISHPIEPIDEPSEHTIHRVEQDRGNVGRGARRRGRHVVSTPQGRDVGFGSCNNRSPTLRQVPFTFSSSPIPPGRNNACSIHRH